MGRIQVLTERVANQIAAGEVVERPASVCKELIENSLDAGATQLRIELRRGGRSLIKVSDNGCGMNRDDAMLAFERHATSKLRSAGDLLAIATLGFRGEALPSIASVSRVTLRTRCADDEAGTVVEIRGGRMRDVRDASLAPGTSVAVRNLFFNVPARRKFLRTEKTELSHAVRMATHYSLAHLGKSFQLRNERGALLGVTPVSTLRERVYQVFGGDTLERLVEIEPARDQALRLGGFVSEPQAQRPNRNSVHVFVNRRLVRDSLVLKAISSAYENLMPKGVFPFALLFLEIPPEEVDVNVHPAKIQVRFRNPSGVFALVRSAIRRRLVADKPASRLPQPGQIAQRDPTAKPVEGGPLPRSLGAQQPPGTNLAPASLRFGFADGSEFPATAFPRAAAAVPDVAPLADTQAEALHSRSPLVDRRPASLGNLGGLRLLGQVHDSFIVAAGDDGVWIIDQHVAHERILFEKVLEARLHGKPDMQRLLAPIVLTLTPGQTVAFEKLAEEFRGNGFEIEPFGGRTVAIKATPAELSPRRVELLIYEILDDSRERGRGLTLGQLRKRMAATIACHAAIKVNMPLAIEKMRWLLEELARTQCPMSCPHGRPIALRYGTRDILKAFHRL
jgi:DNA mismatch repair protein MutL